jgi:hypothetical protein
MGHKRKRRSFETPRKHAAPQDDGGGGSTPIWRISHIFRV